MKEKLPPKFERCPSPQSEKFGHRHVQGVGLFSNGCHFCGLYMAFLPPSAITMSNTEYVRVKP